MGLVPYLSKKKQKQIDRKTETTTNIIDLGQCKVFIDKTKIILENISFF